MTELPDPHRQRAAEMYEISEAEVQPWQRGAAKLLSFGKMYGADRLPDTIRISKDLPR